MKNLSVVITELSNISDALDRLTDVLEKELDAEKDLDKGLGSRVDEPLFSEEEIRSAFNPTATESILRTEVRNLRTSVAKLITENKYYKEELELSESGRKEFQALINNIKSILKG